MKSLAFTLVLSLYIVFLKAGTPFRKCSDKYPLPLFVQIEDCETSPCPLIRGKVYAVDIQFVATKDHIYYLESEVRAKLLGLNIPYPLPNEANDVCKNLAYGAYCPLYAGEDVTYHIDFPLESTYPEVSLKCEIKILDIYKDVMVCFVVDLQVRKG